jgi:adenosylcobinamide-GDP ribazoletransferase
VVTLILSLQLRVVLAAEAGPLALLAAEMISRSGMAFAMSWSQAAGEGLARSAGNASTAAALIPAALALGLAIVLTGPFLLWGVLLATCAVAIILTKSNARLGGYTGDILGTVQQLALLALLLGACLGP